MLILEAPPPTLSPYFNPTFPTTNVSYPYIFPVQRCLGPLVLILLTFKKAILVLKLKLLISRRRDKRELPRRGQSYVSSIMTILFVLILDKGGRPRIVEGGYTRVRT
jgi:hypothetical protein